MQCRQTGSTTSELGQSIQKAGRDSSTVTVPSPLDFVFEMVVKQEADGEVLTLTDRWVELDWWMKQSFLNRQTKGCELCNALTASLPHDVKKLPAMDLNHIPLPR